MRVLGVVLALWAVGCDDDTGGNDLGAADLSVGDLSMRDLSSGSDGGASVARGEYLVKVVIGCGDCHSTPTAMGAPDPNQFLAGGREFDLPGAGPDGGTGAVYAANLTPDPTTGLGMWTQSNITDALTVGVDINGIPLWPIMPYYMFGNLTMDDANSIALYLESIPAITHAVPENTAPQPAMAAPRLADSMIPHTTLSASDSAFASSERGRYLAEVACIECHTEDAPFGSASVLALSKSYAGGKLFPLGFETTISANLTPDATGLAGWSVLDIANTLLTNQEKGTGAMLCPPMRGGALGLGGLTQGDVTDLANYVHTLPPIDNGPFACPDGGN